MKEERFFYPAAEDKEPTPASASNSNHVSSIHGSMRNGVPTLESERPSHSVEHTDFLGKDNSQQDGMESTDYASSKRRPNAEALSEEINQQIRQVIISNFAKYLRMWHSSENLNVPIRDIQSDIYSGLYEHVPNPAQTDLVRTFTPKRIEKIFFEILNDQG